MIEWVPFLIGLLAGLLKIYGREKIEVVFVIVTTILSGIAGVILVIIDGIFFPPMADLTVELLATYLWAGFIGAIIPPIAQYIVTVKLKY